MQKTTSTCGILDHPAVKDALNLLDVWWAALRDYEGIPGFSIGLALDQDFWGKGYGYANLDEKIAATPETIYSICSISKLFTSICMLKLRDQGKLELHDRVDKHLDWFKIKQTAQDSGPINIEGLLTHSAGLPREAGEFCWNGPDFSFPTRDEMMAYVQKQKTLYPAATYLQYSNLGFTLAGEIVAACSGQPYTQTITDHIIKPLGMSNTRPYFPLDAYGKEMAIGYSAKNRQGERTALRPFDTASATPAAGLTSNVIDLAKFASWQFRLLEKGGEEVLHASTLREMQRVHWMDPDWKTTFGLGFEIYRNENKTLVGHSGLCPGYSSLLLIDLKSKLAGISMINACGDEIDLLTNAFKVIGPALARARQATQKPVTDFSKYVGNYDCQPWGGEMAIIQWKGQLASLSLPTKDPMEVVEEYKHIEGNTFRRVRKDDGALAEPLVFQSDDSGMVTGMVQHNYRLDKIASAQ